jgi:hypothetical protein
MNLKERTYLCSISVLRIYVGYYLLKQGLGKFQRDFSKGDWSGRQIGDFAALDLYPWYNNFPHGDVVLHQEPFGGAPMARQQTFIVALAIFALSNPGGTLGLDGLLFGGGKGKGAR